MILNDILQNAQAINPTSAPDDPQIVRWPFGEKFSKHWDGLVYAQLRLLNAVIQYDKGRHKACARLRRTVGHRLDDFVQAIGRSEAFAVKRCDRGRSDRDRHERNVLARFLRERAVPFAELLKRTVEGLDRGTPLEIRPVDIPIWFDEIPD